MASGLSFYAGMHQGWGWFPDRPGFASGLILAGFGGGGFIFNSLSTKLINPDNLNKVDDPITYYIVINDRFEYMFMTLIFCWLSFTAVGVIGVFRPPKDVDMCGR